MRIKRLTLLVTILFAASCTTSKKTTREDIESIRIKYVGGIEIPYNLIYNNTVVGGLSGIDYDSNQDLYYLISDDRSEKSPARFYTAKIYFTPSGLDSLIFTGVINLLQKDGLVYPDKTKDRFKTPDPESIRFNPNTGLLLWSSEGERIVNNSDTVLTDPSVISINTNGKYIDEFELPANLKMQPGAKGPRRNGVLEGMSFSGDFKTLYVNLEEPLYEDGPRADITDNGAFIRILKFNVDNKKCIAQYAYKLEPVAYPAIPPGAFKINGVPEILSMGNNKLLVIERSYSTGRLPNTIKLFMADLNAATDVSMMVLKDNRSFIPASKKLLMNMDNLGIHIDNIEGMVFGPLLPNGHKTLLCIADNNFSVVQKTQVLLFEVLD